MCNKGKHCTGKCADCKCNRKEQDVLEPMDVCPYCKSYKEESICGVCGRIDDEKIVE